MIKVDNRKVVSEIASTTYKANKKRNMLTILAVILTTLLLTTIIGIGSSYYSTIAERSIRMNGMDYDIELSEPTDRQVEEVRSMESVEAAGILVKCAIVEQYREQSVGKLQLYWADSICWEKQCLPAFELMEGDYPQSADEIVLSRSALKVMGITSPELGMEIPLTYYFLSGKEQINTTNYFRLSGYFRDYSGHERGFVSEKFYKESGAKQTDFTQGFLKISLKNSLYSRQDILDMQNAIGLENKQYLSADNDSISDFIKASCGLMGIMILVMISGYLFIFNTLYISISKDIRYYGQLKTIGMTSVQLKKIIYLQAFWDSVVGIPIGLCLGSGISVGLIPKVLELLNPSLNKNIVITVWPIVCVGAALFAAVTVFISCRKPAVIAGDASPIEAIRFTTTGSSKQDRYKESGGILSMAWTNIFRDKKQAAVILTSFALTLSVFIIVTVVIRENDAKRILNHVWGQDLKILNGTTLEGNKALITDDKVREVENIEGVSKVGRVYSEHITVPYQEEVFGEFYKKLYKSRYAPGNYEDDIEAYKKDENARYDMFSSRIIGLDEEAFHALNEGLGGVLDKKEFDAGEIAIAENFFDVTASDSIGKRVHFKIRDADNNEKEGSVMIDAVCGSEQTPEFFAGGYTPGLIVSENYLRKLTGELYTELLNISYENPFDSDTENRVKAVFADEDQIIYESKLDEYQEMAKSEVQIKLLGSGFALVLALLAALNYINMIAAGIQNRNKELAVLESIGMTGKQIHKMLMLEGIGYAVISGLVSIAAGGIASYFVFMSLNTYEVGFSVPVLVNLVLFVIVLGICAVIPPMIYRGIKGKSVIERLRDVQE